MPRRQTWQLLYLYRGFSSARNIFVKYIKNRTELNQESSPSPLEYS